MKDNNKIVFITSMMHKKAYIEARKWTSIKLYTPPRKVRVFYGTKLKKTQFVGICVDFEENYAYYLVIALVWHDWFYLELNDKFMLQY